MTEDYLKKDILTMAEAALLTGLTKSCLYKMTMKRVINFSKPGGKIIFFRKADLEEYMMSNAHKSKSQITEEVEQFLTNKNNKQ